MYTLSTIYNVIGTGMIIVYGYTIDEALITASGDNVDDMLLIDYLDRHITMIMIHPLRTKEKHKLQAFVNLYNEILDTAIVNHYKNCTNATRLIRYAQTGPSPMFLLFKRDLHRIQPIFRWKNLVIRVLNESFVRADYLWNKIHEVRLM